MNLLLSRFLRAPDYTLGVLYVDSEPFGFTLEDAVRDTKIQGKTAIPAGEYSLAMRTEGGLAKRYGDRFDWHHSGMIWLQNVPNYEWVCIHPGNTQNDTEGCPLVADGAIYNGSLYKSVDAYRRIYERVVPAVKGGGVLLVVR